MNFEKTILSLSSILHALFRPGVITFLTLGFGLWALDSKGQTMGGGVTISGTTNAILQINGTAQTNRVYVTVPSRTIVLSGVSNTNEIAQFSYGLCQAGFTNLNLIATTNWAFSLANGGTNGGSVSIYVPQQTIGVDMVTWAQASIGSTNSNQIYVP